MTKHINNLIIERVKLNLTQRELSELSNVGINTIVKLEKGNITGTRVGTLQKIANALDKDMITLFFKKTKKRSEYND